MSNLGPTNGLISLGVAGPHEFGQPQLPKQGLGTRGRGWLLHRTFYDTLSRGVVTRSNSGPPEPNYSEIIGTGVSAGISNLYYPDAERTWSRRVIASRGGIPLIDQGLIIGAIGCSGGTDSQGEVVSEAGSPVINKLPAGIK